MHNPLSKYLNINNIANYLHNSESLLGKIIQRADSIRQLENQLKTELSSEFSDHFWVGGYQNGLLSLFVDSAVLATKLRFSVPDMRDKLRKIPQWSGLKSIEIKVMVTMPENIHAPLDTEKQTQKLDISDETKAQIQGLADYLEQTEESQTNQALAKALRALTR